MLLGGKTASQQGVLRGRFFRISGSRVLGGPRVGRGGHGAFGIEQMGLVRSESQSNERPRIGSSFGLPAVVGLILLHRRLGSAVPHAGGFSAQVMFANEGGLDLRGALRVNLLLAAFARACLFGLCFLALLVVMGTGTGWVCRGRLGLGLKGCSGRQ